MYPAWKPTHWKKSGHSGSGKRLRLPFCPKTSHKIEERRSFSPLHKKDGLRNKVLSPLFASFVCGRRVRLPAAFHHPADLRRKSRQVQRFSPPDPCGAKPRPVFLKDRRFGGFPVSPDTCRWCTGPGFESCCRTGWPAGGTHGGTAGTGSNSRSRPGAGRR